MKIPRVPLGLSGLLVCLLCFGPSNAMAAVTYTYQGLPLVSNFSPPLAFGDSMTGFIAFTEAPTSGNYSAEDFLDYGFGIGAFYLSKANGAGASAQFNFDGAGAITSWSIVITDYPYKPPPHLVEIWINSADLPPSAERILITDSVGGTNLASVSAPGSWALVPVPEPTAATLLAFGIAYALRLRCRNR